MKQRKPIPPQASEETRGVESRRETDTMGEVAIPSWAYWGAQTQRAVENFGVSDKTIPAPLIRAIGLLKRCAAETNGELGLIDASLVDAIVRAAAELIDGTWDDHFPVDVFQTGSGTSWNMNANEVIANRANEILGFPLGKKRPVHPNDHVNRGQSSNDVIPTAIHMANRVEAERLIASLGQLEKALEAKASEFQRVVKIGRTHLQDAVPMTLGQEFSGYQAQIRNGRVRIAGVLPRLEDLALGGTVIGTGLNAHPEFGARTILKIANETGVPFRRAENAFEAIASRDAQSELMGAVNTAAGSLAKIAQDLRILSSGPRAGLGEIMLPSLQPGSSIMPGKINPVVPEMVIQVAAFIMGKNLSVAVGSQSGPLELNIMMPLIAYETLTALRLMANTCEAFADRCIAGIQADEARCRQWIEWSLALVTPLATRIGYDQAAKLAYEAFREKKTIREVVRAKKILTEDEIDVILDPNKMLGC